MNKLTTIALVTVAAACFAGPAAAHPLAKKPAVKAAKVKAAKIGVITEADRTEVQACTRENKHRWSCLGVLHYSTDAARCEVPITVSFKRHQSRKPRAVAGDTLCY